MSQTVEKDALAARSDFPALQRDWKGGELVYLDGPAGTQVPSSVIEAISGYYRHCNANTCGQFPTSRESDQALDEARAAAADFLGAADRCQISFGANMTTLNFSLSRAIARSLTPGDEVVITQLDHEANRGPWLALRRRGIVVREVAMLQGGELDYVDFERKVGEKTRLVAVGLASNALGTVNDIAFVKRLCRRFGAWLLADAVHFAPHFSIDAESLGVDFLLCSAYKFYGPHVGILYCRDRLLEQLETERLKTQYPNAPYRIETGTLNHAAIVGVRAAVDYIASLGQGSSRRQRLESAFARIGAHERRLAEHLYRRLGEIPGVTLYGPPFEVPMRAPTVSFTIAGVRAAEAARQLGAAGIQVWDGDFYAARAVEVLGLSELGGLIRVGMAVYNTLSEIHRLLEAVEGIAAEGKAAGG